MLVIIQLVSVIASVVGIVFYFLGTEWVAILCGSITLIDSILQTEQYVNRVFNWPYWARYRYFE